MLFLDKDGGHYHLGSHWAYIIVSAVILTDLIDFPNELDVTSEGASSTGNNFLEMPNQDKPQLSLHLGSFLAKEASL